MSSTARHYLIFDGECDFCRAWAEWVAFRDVETRKFRICPWQVVPSPPMTPLLQIQARRAVQLITDEGQRLQGGQAVLFALRETGWHPRFVRLLEHRPFVWVVDAGYRIVAANRPRFGWLAPR
jgi:predicted DCC family thiol-disulfide oxidoreductase YuxK